MGNLRSVAKALARVGPQFQVDVTADPARVAAADRVVVPGQGAMPDCMRELRARQLHHAVLDATRSKPFLGICIGVQMLFDSSEEGDVAGLGLFRGSVRRFRLAAYRDRNGAPLKVPHMGWNGVDQMRSHPMWQGIVSGERFYFVHSYYVEPADQALIAGATDYGARFTSAVARDNIFAVQFHPEKSQRAGLSLLQNFLTWQP
jgi:glutamine amidotransferase